MPTNQHPRIRDAVWTGVANAATALTTTGLALVVTGVARRRRRSRELDVCFEARQRAYERFVTDFGTAEHLSDRQLAALAAYASISADHALEGVIAELLRGRPWNWRDERDQLDEDQPRVRHLTAVADGLDRP